MKTINFIKTLSFVLLSCYSFGQVSPGANCDQAGCSLNGSYPSLTGVASMGQFGCLYSTPNANWVAIAASASGNIDITLTQGGDVDFAAYGPFTSVAAGCPIGPNTPQVDCSYSASSTEYINIPNAQPGQVYILLITNYSNSPSSINLNVTNGSINCNINFSGTATMTPATCGQATGSVTAAPNGGFAPYTYSWNTPGGANTQTVNNVPPGTYTVTITSANDPVTGSTVNPTTASVTVTNQNATYTSTSTPASCAGGNDGTATANFNSGGAPGVTATYLWNDPAAQTTQTAVGLLPGTYQCAVTLSNGCSGTTSTTVGNNAVAYSSTSTVVSCPGGNDGTATATMNPVVGILNYQWDDALAQVSATATGLSAGSYTCTITSDIGCTGTTNVIVSEIPGMIGNIVAQSDVTCNSGNDGMIAVNVTQGTAPYTYSWDNSTSTLPVANDLYAGTHTVTVTDANGCVITITGVIGEPSPLNISFLTANTQICPEADITLNVTGAGGSSAYTFTWFENGTNIGTGTSMLVDPVLTNTQYCVELSEACGSPTDQECTLIYFPTPIVPSAEPIEAVKCVPNTFEFLNTSTNGGEIATTFWEFDGNPMHTTLEVGNDSTSFFYSYPGEYDIILTTTSIFGCVYTDTMKSLITVLPSPTADFSFSTNPATIFETTITMQNKSSYNTVDWQWFSPGSIPTTSSYTNPTFQFPEGVVGTYPVTLVVTTEFGCTDTTVLYVNVIEDILFYAPNAFTPDGDELNQTWNISVAGIDIYDFELFVFNRWGEVVWESHDPSIGWDGTYMGKIIQAGAYQWKAVVKSNYKDERKVFTGSVSILK